MAGWQADISNARVDRSFHVDLRQALALLYAILNKHWGDLLRRLRS
jgi:hypothetical protein